MNKTRSAFFWGCWILGLSLVSALGRADSSAQPKVHAVDSRGPYSPSTLYNLGNAAARAGQPALAVLNYERARLLAPLDPDIDANLRHVLDAASLPVAPKSFEERLRLMSPNATYWFGLTGLIIAGGSSLLLALKISPRIVSGAALSAGLLMVAYALIDAVAITHWMRAAVVMQSASASASPIVTNDALFTLAPGSLVQIQEAHGDYLLIRDSRGNVGWVARQRITPVIDPEGEVQA